MRSVHDAIEYGARKLRYQELKFEQTKDKSSIDAYLAGRDVLVGLTHWIRKKLIFPHCPICFRFHATWGKRGIEFSVFGDRAAVVFDARSTGKAA